MTYESFESIMDFTNNNIYMIFAIARSKNNNGITSKQQVVIREPVRSLESFPYKVAKLKSAARLRDLNFYIYVSVNARSTLKGYINFKNKLNEYASQAMFGKDDYKYQLSRLNNVWYSSLMQPNARATKYFLIDVDTKEMSTVAEVIGKVEQYKTNNYNVEVKHVTPSRNGFHIVTDAFDPRILEGIPDVSIQKDGLLYLDCAGFNNVDGDQ